MHRLLLFLLLPLLWVPPAAAESGHARDAFAFADRRDWKNARAHAKQANDETLKKLITWQYLLDADARASFDEISLFITENPGWPDIKKLRRRAEAALFNGRKDGEDVIGWFEAYPPLSGAGKIALAEALMAQGGAAKRVNALAREAWIDGDFEEAEEKDLLKRFGGDLTSEDHIARADRLLWDEKTAAAKRMLRLLPRSYQYLVEARRLLIKNERSATPALSVVPKELKNDPGLIYNRLQYRARRGDDDGVREMLLAAPASLPYPEKWWRYRESQVRSAIGDGKYTLAQKLLENHEQLSGAELADAAWLSGWLQLEFLKKPQAAYDIFSHMYDSVSYPVSRARAAFWAGRAAAAAGDSGAENWYATASAWPTTFYGQLAAYKRYGDRALRLPDPPEIDNDVREEFERNDLAQAVNLCLRHGARDLAGKLISFLIETAADKEQTALAADLGVRAGHPYLGVRGAKKAMQKSIVLTESGYPRPKTPTPLPIERALTLAIARQESEFDPRAVSSSNARGLMQLLPSTAKETARKLKMPYSKERLFDTDYNMRLGSHYLSRLVDGYDGSYVMAIAAYNAGPGNVRKWLRRFGSPGANVDDAMNWIEKIPFAETRNYVQRVLENAQVYRALEGKEELGIAKDLAR